MNGDAKHDAAARREASRTILGEKWKRRGSGVIKLYVDPKSPVRDAHSMEPLLYAGDAVAWRRQQSVPRRGDLLFYDDVARRVFVVHRCIGLNRSAGRFTTKGDGRPEADSEWVAYDHVIGRVLAVRCGGHWYSCEGFGARTYALAAAGISWVFAGVFALASTFEHALAPRDATGKMRWVSRCLGWWPQAIAQRLIRATAFRACHRALDDDLIDARFGGDGA